ncbi:MAG: hypothetical protein ACT4TC_16140 [Myxococcaceae bacterium]
MTSYLLLTLTLVTTQSPADAPRADSSADVTVGEEDAQLFELSTRDPYEDVTVDGTPAVLRREEVRARFLERREREIGKRLVVEGLGGALGIALGSWLPLAYAQSGCSTTTSTTLGCFPTWMAPLLGIGVMPFTLFAAGRIIGNPGAYGWAILGSLPGWAIASVTFYVVDQSSGGKINPFAYAAFLLPIIPALILFEWSGGRNALEQLEEQDGGLAILPGGPNGSFGASVVATF